MHFSKVRLVSVSDGQGHRKECRKSQAGAAAFGSKIDDRHRGATGVAAGRRSPLLEFKTPHSRKTTSARYRAWAIIDMGEQPMVVGQTVRDAKGLFVRGNRASVGRGGDQHDIAKRRYEFRKALYAAVTDEDFQAIVKKLVYLATKKSSIAAAKLLLDKLLGNDKLDVEINDNTMGAPIEANQRFLALVEAIRRAPGDSKP